MMWNEFMEIAGYEVSYDTYTKVIEPMYMALPDVSKQDFVKMLDKKAFALPTRKEMVREMKKIAQFLFDNCGVASYGDEQVKLEDLAKQYAKRFFGFDWANDFGVSVYFNRKYAYRGVEMERGCTFPYELVICKCHREYERIVLVK